MNKLCQAASKQTPGMLAQKVKPGFTWAAPDACFSCGMVRGGISHFLKYPQGGEWFSVLMHIGQNNRLFLI